MNAKLALALCLVGTAAGTEQATRTLRGSSSEYTNQFDNVGSGKCTINNGRNPKSRFLANTNENQCKKACRKNTACSGYSAATTGNCLLWLEGPLDNTSRYGDSWGGASCNVRQQQRPTAVPCLSKCNKKGIFRCGLGIFGRPNTVYSGGIVWCCPRGISTCAA
jgi:hypothetical protein